MDGDQGESGSLSDDYLNDSFASIGNSTRSLLSPILNEKLYIKTSTPGKDRQEYENQKREEENDHDYIPEKSRNMVLTSISLAKRGGDVSLSRTDRSSRTGSSYSSSFSSSYSQSSKQNEKDGQLSPWESWLIKKTSENREKRKMRKMEETKKKMELEEKEKEKESKRQDIEEKLSIWLQKKDETEKVKREEKKRELKEQRESKVKKQMEIDEKSQKVFNQWLEEKKAADLEAKKKKENEEWDKKQKEVEKRMKSEEAFEKWLQNCKCSRSNNQSSGQVGLQGCYDWASYPCPSYINPMPWVPPASKHKGRSSKKKELQPVSPPLLFRDYEQRTKKTSRKQAVK